MGGWGVRGGLYGWHAPTGGGSGAAGVVVGLIILPIWAAIWLFTGWLVAGLIVLRKFLRIGRNPLTWWDVPILVVCAFVLADVFLLAWESSSPALGQLVLSRFKSLPFWTQAILGGGYLFSLCLVREYNRQGDLPPGVMVLGRNPEFLRFARAALWPLGLVGVIAIFGFFLVSDLTTAVIYVSVLTLIWLPLGRAIDWVNRRGTFKRRDPIVLVFALACLATAVAVHGLGRTGLNPQNDTRRFPAAALPSPSPVKSGRLPEPAAIFEWVGFENSSVRDRENELRKQVGGRFRRVNAQGNFADLCRSIGGECMQVRDWEGRNLPCDAGLIRHDGTRLALCRFPQR
jgi:hypothetical protein